jgi:hypothetical protein
VVPALAIAALVPAVWRPDFRSLPQRWPFFTEGAYRLCIPEGENVVVFPYGFRGDSMLWQAESDFWFRMAEGYLTPKPPEPFIDDPLVQKLTYTYELAGAGADPRLRTPQARRPRALDGGRPAPVGPRHAPLRAAPGSRRDDGRTRLWLSTLDEARLGATANQSQRTSDGRAGRAGTSSWSAPQAAPY